MENDYDIVGAASEGNLDKIIALLSRKEIDFSSKLNQICTQAVIYDHIDIVKYISEQYGEIYFKESFISNCLEICKKGNQIIYIFLRDINILIIGSIIIILI